MRDVVFVFGGEGAHSADTDLELVKTSPAWNECMSALEKLGIADGETFVSETLGKHSGAASVVATTVINLCLCDVWRGWGVDPEIAVGHSVGELAAAYASGLYTAEQALETAMELGQIGATKQGAMLHTVTEESSFEPLALAAVNYRGPGETSVTLCGDARGVEEWIAKDQKATKLKPEHPWHHPTYESKIKSQVAKTATKECRFVSATKPGKSTIEEDHWQTWLHAPVAFADALEGIQTKDVVVELGPHSVLSESINRHLKPSKLATSMRRGEPSIPFALEQRQKLASFVQRKVLAVAEESIGPVKWDISLGDQGYKSADFVRLANALGRRLYPGLEAHHFYRFQSLQDLEAGYLRKSDAEDVSTSEKSKNDKWTVAGVGVALAGGVDSLEDVWQALESGGMTDKKFDFEKIRGAAAQLFPTVAEAEAADDQQLLAMVLARRALEDAGSQVLDDYDKTRVGIYIGAWQQCITSVDKPVSAYDALGKATSALPGRVAAMVDARGPAILINTACSSALAAIDASLGDLRRGRIDAAIVGGLNVMENQQRLEEQLGKARFLSPTGKCHTFSSLADGYARSQGGVFFVVTRDDINEKGLAQICGSAVTQNRRQRPLSAVDGVAQERCVRLACADAGIDPSDLAVIECHGTGTPLGDPVEVEALVRSGVRAELAAAKATFGHLESGAGAVGLASAILFANRRKLVRPQVSGGTLNPKVLAICNSGGLGLPDERRSTTIDLPQTTTVGVSSFGFAGSNAHVIVTSSPKRNDVMSSNVNATETVAPVPLPVVEEEREPVPRTVAEPKSDESSIAAPEDVVATIWTLVARVGVEKASDDADLFDLGIDSLGLAELCASIESIYGEDVITVDDVFDQPSVAAIAALVDAKKGAEAAKPLLSTPPAQKEENIVTDPSVVFVSEQDAIDDESARKEVPPPSPQWFSVTHVGSLPRDSESSDMETVVQRQISCGVDILNDGEWSRPNYVAELIARIGGLGEDGVEAFGRKESACSCCAMPIAIDMLMVPLHARRFDGSNGIISLNPKRLARANVACIGEPTYLGGSSLSEDLASLKEAARGRACFWSVPSPGTLATFCEDRYYSKSQEFDADAHEKYVFALAAAVKPEYEAIAATGVALQIDCPDVAMGFHTKWAGLDEKTFVEKVVDVNVRALNAALKDIQGCGEVRVHVCFGNYSGPHTADISIEAIWKSVLKIDKATTISLETANSRHQHEWERVFETQPLPKNKRLAPGVIDTKSSVVEHPELVARRLLRFAKTLGPWQIVASTDCGFASTGKSTALTSDVAWLKLETLGRGAALARRHVYNLLNPSPTSPDAAVLRSVGFRAVVVGEHIDDARYESLIERCAPWPVEKAKTLDDVINASRHALDWPLAIVASDEASLAIARAARNALQTASAKYARRAVQVFGREDSVDAVETAMKNPQRIDKLTLLGGSMGSGASVPRRPPTSVDVLVVGAGLCGLVAALAVKKRGLTVAVVERRLVVGGVWSSFANSTSQVNSSEGGYNTRGLVPKVYEETDGAAGANRDHTPTYEVVSNISQLASAIGEENIYRGVDVVKIVDGLALSRVVDVSGGGYNDASTTVARRGIVVAVNDRVGVPRPLSFQGSTEFVRAGGVLARGLGDDLVGVDWRGKRVVIVGFGAFAVENARTALEHGAEHVTVLARRTGTVCPKIIDYLNFVKPFNQADFRHDTATNVKQMLRWRQLYEASGATQPECWPSRIKHDGHTISVSDVWWIAHFMGKLKTEIGTIETLHSGGLVTSSGLEVPCDVVVSCIGFERNTTLCSDLTGATAVKETNFLSPRLMYLADAEIDEGAFNFFFGSSVLEYAKFYSEVFALSLQDDAPDGLHQDLWGPDIASSHIDDRKWSHYISAARRLVDAYPQIRSIAETQINERTAHFWGSLPPKTWIKANKQEWVELHARLNGGVPVPPEKQLPYFFEDSADWCGSHPVVLLG